MTEQEIEKKLEQFKSGLELFKSKLNDARETIGARDAEIEDIEKDNDVLQKMNNEKAKEIEELKEQLSQKDNYEMSEQQRRDINTMNELAGKVSSLETNNEKLLKENTGLDLENQYLKKEIEKLKNEMAELEEAAEINKQVEVLDQLRDEVQKAKENSDELYTENENLKVKITSMELAYQELDLVKAGLEDKLEKEKQKNEALAKESISNKSEIDKERSKLSKKVIDLKSKLEEANMKYSELENNYHSLENNFKALKASYEKAKQEKKSSIVSLPAKKVEDVIVKYRLGPTSENVMAKFISVVKEAYKNIKKDASEEYFIISNLSETAKSLGINDNDAEVISNRLLEVVGPSGEKVIQIKDGQTTSILSMEELISWISAIKE